MAKINTSSMETRALVAGQQTSIPIREKFLDSGMLLNIRGTLNVAGGTGAGTILSHAAARAARRIEVRGASNSRVSLRGLSLAAINRILERGGYSQDNPASLAAGAADAFSGWLRIPFAMPHSSKPFGFGFNTMGVSAPTLVIDTAPASELATGANGVLSYTGIEVEVIEEAIMEPETFPTGRLRVQQFYIDVANAGNARKVYLDDLGVGTELRAVLLEGMSGGDGETGFEYDNDVVQAAALVIDGGYAVERTTFGAIRQRNKNTYQLPAIETGAALLDAAEDFATGPGQLWTIRKAQRPYLELDVAPQGAGDSRVWVTTLVAER